jgi:hypothetical protein
MLTLNGKYQYQSYVSLPADIDRTAPPPARPVVKRPALSAAPWTPSAPVEFKTDEAGSITGSGKLLGLDVILKGKAVPGIAGAMPEGIELTVTVANAVYQLRGYVVANSNHIVGTVVTVNENDLGGQPVGASGPFLLLPL